MVRVLLKIYSNNFILHVTINFLFERMLEIPHVSNLINRMIIGLLTQLFAVNIWYLIPHLHVIINNANYFDESISIEIL